MRGLQSLRLFAGVAALAVFVALPLPPPVTGQDGEAQATKKVYARTGLEGTITGTIHFAGKAPARNQIDPSSDVECVKSNPKLLTDDVLVTKGKLANVFVYVTGGALDDYTFEPPAQPAVLDQQGCRFVPRMVGVQVGQPLNVLNSDTTTHNVNVQSKNNFKGNQSHAAGGPPIVRTFARAEMLIPIKCNMHPWMKAFVNVMKHPFFAVSSRDGSYRLEGLPPGDYTLVARHERFGEKTMQVTIVPYEMRSLDFTFDVTSDFRYSPR